MAKLSPKKLELLKKLQQQRGLAHAQTPAAQAPPGEGVQLSYAEERGVKFYRLTDRYGHGRWLEDGFRVRGELDVARLEQAFNFVLSRHDILWSKYHQEGDQLSKSFHPRRQVTVPVIDLRDRPEPGRYRAALEELARDVQAQLDIERDAPLMWLKLWRLGDRDHLVMACVPHCVFDVESYRIFWKELVAAYGELEHGRAPAWPRPKQYAEFAAWQRAWHSKEVVERWAAFWKERLARCQPLSLALPTDRPRDAVDAAREKSHLSGAPAGVFSWPIGPALTRGVEQLARDAKVPPFTAALAALAVVLGRKTGLEEITVATVNNMRNRVAGLEGVIGFFNNNALLRVSLAGERSFHAALERLRGEVMETLAVPEFQLIPFVYPRFNELFRFLFNYVGSEPVPQWPGLSLERVPIGLSVVTLPELGLAPLRFHGDMLFRLAKPDDTSLVGTIIYRQDLWDEATVRALAGEYVAELDAAVAQAPGPT